MVSYTVLFDLDGTLLDSIELILDCKRHTFRTLGVAEPSDSEWLTWLGTPLSSQFARYLPDPARIPQFIAEYRNFQDAEHDRLVRAYPGAAQALADLRAAGHPIGIVTSKGVEGATRGLRCTGLLEFADTIVGVDSTQRHKPDPEPVRVALERLGAEPARAMFVGDSVFDMAAGNGAGVATAAALWGPSTRETLASASPTWFLERLSELPPLVARVSGGPPETARSHQA